MYRTPQNIKYKMKKTLAIIDGSVLQSKSAKDARIYTDDC